MKKVALIQSLEEFAKKVKTILVKIYGELKLQGLDGKVFMC